MPLVNSTTYKGKIVKDMNSKEMLISLAALIYLERNKRRANNSECIKLSALQVIKFSNFTKCTSNPL